MSRLIFFAVIICAVVIVRTVFVKGDDDASSDQKPVYHVTPESGHWMNDPNGPMLFNGYYHLFYQYNPYGLVWGNMSWGHVVSQDLIFWEREPVALYNDDSFDINGCFSGSAAITTDNNPYLFYTCVNADEWELQCVAERQPDTPTYDTTLTNWTKPTQNPIIASAPDGFSNLDFRDPALWELTSPPTGYNPWNMILAATEGPDKDLNNTGVIAIYTATAAGFPYEWQYQGPLWSTANNDSAYYTWMVECPDLYSSEPTAQMQLDTGVPYILKYSVMETRQDIYEVGQYVSTSDGGSVFERDLSYSNPFATQEGETNGLLYDYGPENTFYASKTFFDEQRGQRVLWGWSPEQGSEEDAIARDFQGVQSMPRALTLDTTAKILYSEPAKAVVNNLAGEVLYQSPPNYAGYTATEDTPTEAATAAVAAAVVAARAATEEASDGLLTTVPVQDTQLAVTAVFRASSGCTNMQDIEGYQFGVQARRSDDGSTYTSYGFSIQQTDVLLDSSSSTTTATTIPAVHAYLDSSKSGGTTPSQQVDVPIPGQTNDANMFLYQGSTLAFKFDLYLDHSQSEIFMQKGALAATMRIYPDDSDQGLAWYITHSSGAGYKFTEEDDVSSAASGASSNCFSATSASCGICFRSLTATHMNSIWDEATNNIKP